MGGLPGVISSLIPSSVATFQDEQKKYAGGAALGVGKTTKELDSAYNSKDPMAAKTWAEAGAAVEGKTRRLLNNPEYQKLSIQDKVAWRSKIYDDYYAPMSKKFGKPVMDKKGWLLGTQTDRWIQSPSEGGFAATYGAGAGGEAVERYARAVDRKAADFSIFGARLSKALFLDSFGLLPMFGIPSPTMAGIVGKEDVVNKALGAATSKVFDKWIGSMKQNQYADDYWIGTHPRDGILANFANISGEQTMMLPLYGVLSEAGVGAAVIEGTGIGGSLTARLGTSIPGKAVAGAINGAFVGLASSMIGRGAIVPNMQDIKEGASWAAMEGVFGAAGGWLDDAKILGAGKELKVANEAAIKQWQAKVMAQGGDPLAHASFEAAINELRSTGVPPPPGGAAKETTVHVAMGWQDAMAEAQKVPEAARPTVYRTEGGVTIVAKEGFDVYGRPLRKPGVWRAPREGELHDQPEVAPTPPTYREGPHNIPAEDRLKNDPVLHALVTGQKMVLESISAKNFEKPFHALSSGEQDQVIQHALGLTEEAKYQMRVSNPEETKAEVAARLREAAAADPEVAARLALLKQNGIDLEQAVTDHEIDAEARMTGVKNPDRAATKIAHGDIGWASTPSGKRKSVAGILKTFSTLQREFERAGDSAQIAKLRSEAEQSLGQHGLSPEQIETMLHARTGAARRLGPKPPVEKQITPTRFASHKVETVAKLMAPSKSVGANINLRAMDSKDFINLLREADGNFVNFEDDLHRLFYHHSNREKLAGEFGDEIKRKILTEAKRMLKKRFPGVEMKKEYIDLYSDRGDLHLQMLAQSGRLASEGNMFKSTNLFGAPTDWQTDLNTEIDEQELSFLRKTIQMHPGSLDYMRKLLKNLQSNRAEGLITPDQWRAYNSAIAHNLAGGMGEWNIGAK